ncbi:hypothetical protein [Vallitalea maricola]|uniref:Uncharacterized protein n=1 Tax=Vallitalea maricola TaxID=3074433 RepID=A0ACB5UQR3_9FIRM|nr:hypothetical protein AN2V17_40610 [Vallitalea sp. AN17-2]
MTLLTGEAKERALIGNDIVDNLFQGVELNETLKSLEEVIRTLEFMICLMGEKEQIEKTVQRTESVLSVIKYILNKNKDYDISSMVEIIRYAKSYSANIKDWKSN